MKTKNNIIDKILSGIDEYQSKQFELDHERDVAWQKFLVEKGHKPNTPTSYSIKLLKDNGHNPLAICSYYGEEAFFFKTTEEAIRAYEEMEVEERLVCGWFHSVEEIDNLENPDGSKIEVEWIK